MPMTIRKLPFTNSASPAVSLAPTAVEREMFIHPNLRRWAQAGSRYDVNYFGCMKSEEVLVPINTMPTLNTSGAVYTAYNSKSAYVFGSGSTNGKLVGKGWLPAASDFTILFVGRHGPSPDNAFLFGTDAGVGAFPGTLVQMVSTGAFAGYFTSTLINLTPAYTRPYVDGPSLVTLSWDSAAHRAACRINGGLAAGTRTTGLESASLEGTNLLIGAAGSAYAGTIDGGDFAAVQVWDVDLNKAGNETLRDSVEGYFLSRYSIP